MNINDSLYGFTVTKITKIEDISATAVEMIFEKNGCKLLWLDRPDDNKTFAITFKTIPSDGTGVFHILEHSVLCGSDKYPLKEPFVDLLKGSMQTFLNAMTFPDKTMYPFSTRNDKDLLNLMDVYLDAVFHPLCRNKKEIFMQEGWHIEEDENGDLFFNGVVYNEMRGVFSSVDSLMYYQTVKQLFPDTCYGVESGGDPAVIPSLSYEQFVASYEKFYHPSNATIVLDGEVKLDEVLPLIASYLDGFEKRDCDFEIPLQTAVSPETVRVPYEVSEDDDAIGKVEITKGWAFGRFDEREKYFATAILGSILSESNDSPLKKALLGAGLADDVYISVYSEMKQTFLSLTIRGVPEGREKEAEKAAGDAIAALMSGGVPIDQLTSYLNRAEFMNKEMDFGTMPVGLVNAFRVQESWLYGGEATESLRINAVFEKLRSAIGTSYYERLLDEVFISNPHRATVYMVPDPTLAEKNAADMKSKMAAMKASFTSEQQEELEAENEKLRIFRESVDSPELSALIPHLELSDIKKECKPSSLSVDEIDGVKTLYSKQSTNGIVYLDLYFDISGFDERQLWVAEKLTSVLNQCATKKRSALDFLTLTGKYIGRLGSCISLLGDVKNPDACTPYFKVGIAVLEENKDKVASIFAERAFETVFDENRILEILKQEKINYELSLKESGNRHAMIQAKACLTQRGVMDEIISGETNYRNLIDSIEDPSILTGELASLFPEIIVRSRLTASIIGNDDRAFLKELIDLLPEKEVDLTHKTVKYDGEKNKKISIASDVSYAAKAVNIYNLGKERTGAMSVATSLLTLEYLWNEVRVLGGAYGCSCGCNPSGDLGFSSFRDPNPSRTLGVYDKAAETLAEFAENEDDFTKYVIGAISDMEPIETPYASGRGACVRYLSNVSDDDRNKRRKEILETTKEDITALIPVFEEFRDKGVTCVVGGN